MKRLAVLSMASVLAAGGIGCSAGRPPQAPAPAAAAVAEGPVIVHLVGRHQTITVTSSPSGPRYTAHTDDGATLVANATLDELRADYPEIYRMVEPGVAVSARDDASVPAPEPLMVDTNR